MSSKHEWGYVALIVFVVLALLGVGVMSMLSEMCSDGYVMLNTEHARGCVPFEEYEEIK